jgi:sugar-specific transcriptional regulator TrmB
MVLPIDEGEDKVFTAVVVQAMLDKQHNELNKRFAALKAKLAALDEKNAHPKVVELAPRRSQTRRRLRWKLHLSSMDLLFMLNHEYPIERVPMPHVNPSSSAPHMLDEFNYSY